MTSRISLEAVMSDTGAPAKRQLSTPSPGVDAGKTIRLKRPSEAATVRVTARPRIAKLEESGTSEAKAALNRTARLEESTEEGGEEEGATPTKRKTIRIKRPGQAEAAMDMAVAREEGVPLMVRDDVPHALFPVFAILTLIVVMVSIYVFSAQAFGRNICWTDYSYGVPDMDLPWVNKIPPPAVH